MIQKPANVATTIGPQGLRPMHFSSAWQRMPDADEVIRRDFQAHLQRCRCTAHTDLEIENINGDTVGRAWCLGSREVKP